MATLTHPRPGETEFAIAAGFAAAIAGSLLAADFPPGAASARLAVLAVTVAVGTAVARSVTACLPVAAMAWLFCDGFLIDRYGDLRWHGWPDAVRLAVLVGAALAGLAAGRLWTGTAAEPAGGPAEAPLGQPAQVVLDDEPVR